MADQLDVDLIVRAISEGFDNLQGDFKDTAKAAGETEKSTGLLDNIMGKFVFTAGDVVSGLQTVGSAMWSSVEAAGEAERTVASLDATIQSTGRSGETSTAELYGYAESLRNVSVYGDDAIATGLGVLVGFQQISEETRNNAAPVMLDMAGRFGGVQGAADKLGAALNDFDGFTKVARQIGGFTAEQEAIIAGFKEANDLIGYQDYILDLLSQRFGGQAAAAAQTFSGKMEIIRDRFGEVQEVVGGKVLPLLSTLADEVIPALEQSAEELGPVIEKIAEENLPEMVDQLADLIGIVPAAVAKLDNLYDIAQDIKSVMGPYWIKAGIDSIRELADATESANLPAGVYNRELAALNSTMNSGIRTQGQVITNMDALADHTAYVASQTVIAEVATARWDVTMSQFRATTDEYGRTAAQVADAEERRIAILEAGEVATEQAEEDARALAEAELELANALAQANDYAGNLFESFANAEGPAASLESQFYNVAAAGRLGAGDMAVFANALRSDLTPAEVENILASVEMQLQMEQLIAAVRTGGATAAEAVEAFYLLRDGEAETAAEAVGLIQSANAVNTELDGITGAAIDAANALNAMPTEINVHTNYTSSGVPPYGAGGPGTGNPQNPDTNTPTFMGGGGMGGPINNFNLTLNNALASQSVITQFNLMRGMLGV